MDDVLSGMSTRENIDSAGGVAYWGCDARREHSQSSVHWLTRCEVARRRGNMWSLNEEAWERRRASASNYGLGCFNTIALT